MNRSFTLTFLLFTALSSTTYSQQAHHSYKQFLTNPYLFNPSYVGINNIIEAKLVYRQQWTNFKDAPATADMNLQLPSNDRVSLGFNLHSDSQILLRNTNIMATFGYVVPFSSNQTLRFGISGGIGLNKLNMTADELSSSDPVIRNASTNTLYVKGNFGMLYTFGGLRVGFALTDIFSSNPFKDNGGNQLSLSNLRNRLFSASYRFNLGVDQTIGVEPYFLYRQTEDKLQDYWEGGAVFDFKSHVWTGASYNQHNGLAILLGFNIKDKFKISYSYDFPPFKSAINATSSHELHLGITFGNKKNRLVAKKSVPKVMLANEPKEEPAKNHQLTGNKYPGRLVISETELIKSKSNVPSPLLMESPKVPEEDRVKRKEIPTKASEAFTITKGHHYVVVGVFSQLSHSTKFSKEMILKGHSVNVVLNPKNKFYYVFIFSSTDIEEAQQMRNEYKWKNLFKEAWIFTLPD